MLIFTGRPCTYSCVFIIVPRPIIVVLQSRVTIKGTASVRNSGSGLSEQ